LIATLQQVTSMPNLQAKGNLQLILKGCIRGQFSYGFENEGFMKGQEKLYIESKGNLELKLQAKGANVS